MKTLETKITQKYQTTIPKEIRNSLEIKPGKKVQWNIVNTMVVLSKMNKINDPVGFLTSQIKLDFDAVKLVRDVRSEFG